jgi:hypothetical protein
MSERTSRFILILEAIVIALPISGFALLAAIVLVPDVFLYPGLSHVVALGILALISLFAIGSGWRLFIIFLRHGRDGLKSQHFGWWVMILAGVLVLIASLLSNILPPSPEYSRWWTFRLSFDGFVLGAPILIPLCHLAFERFLRKPSSLRLIPGIES